MNRAQGEIYDLGYQRYRGPRGGRMQAFRTLWVNSFRTILGLGRGGRAKVLPALMSLFIIAPPTVFLVLAAVLPTAAAISHADLYEATAILLLLFSAIIAPELLIPDRRSGAITLYLVRPSTALDYVAARWSAFLCATLAVTLIGQVLLLAANLLVAESAGDFLRENWLDVPRFILAGLVITVFAATIPMAVAAFTERRAYAAAFVIAAFLVTTPMSSILTTMWCEGGETASVSTTVTVEDAPSADSGTEGRTVPPGEGPQQAVTPIIPRGDSPRGPQSEAQSESEETTAVECQRVTGDYAKWFVLLDVGRAPTHLSDLLFDDDQPNDASMLAAELPGFVPIAWYALLVVAPGAILLLRYRRIST